MSALTVTDAERLVELESVVERNTRFQVEAAAHVAGLPPRYRSALLTALDVQAPRSF
jgi:hypothetical protein